MEGSLLGRPGDTLAVAVAAPETGPAVVAADGVIDLVTHPKLERVVTERLAGRDPRVIVDLSGVGLCDSTGLSALIRLHRRAEAAGGWLRLAGVQAQVRRVLEITDLTRLLHLYPDVESARIDTE